MEIVSIYLNASGNAPNSATYLKSCLSLLKYIEWGRILKLQLR